MSDFTGKLSPGETNFVASRPLTQAEADALYFPIDGDVSQGDFGVNMAEVNEAIAQAIIDNELVSIPVGDERYMAIEGDFSILFSQLQTEFQSWLVQQETQVNSLGVGLIESAIAEVNAHRNESPAHTWEQISGKPDFPTLYRQTSEAIDWSEIANIPLLATDWDSISGKPSTFPPSTHTHDWGQITGSPPTSGGETTYNVIRSSPAFVEEYEDFLSLSAPSKLGWSAANTNGWIGAENGNRFPGAFGVMALGINSASAGTSDYSHLRLGSFPVIPKQSEGYSNIEISAVVGLASQSQTELSWSSRFGLLDTGNGLGTNFSILISAEYFNSGYNWVAIWKDGNGGAAQRQVIGSVSGDLSTKLFSLKIKIDCLNFKINFYVDTLETEVIIGSSNWNFGAMSPIFYLSRNSANSLARTFWVDKFLFRKNVSDAVLPETGEVDWIDVLNKPLFFPPETHTHPWSQVTDKPDFNSLYRQNGINIGWNELTEIPATFVPSAHTQDWSTIINPPATATRWPTWTEVTGKPNFDSLYRPAGVAIDWSEIVNAPVSNSVDWSAILNKPATFTPSAHSHLWANITDPPATATRWPSWSEVTSKPSAFVPSAHASSHATGGTDPITPASIGARAAGAIPWTDLSGIPAFATRWPTWTEVTGKPTTFTPSSHTHDWSQITNQPSFSADWPAITNKPIEVIKNTAYAPTATAHEVYIQDDGSWIGRFVWKHNTDFTNNTLEATTPYYAGVDEQVYFAWQVNSTGGGTLIAGTVPYERLTGAAKAVESQINFAYGSGWSAYSATDYIASYRRVDKQVFLAGLVKRTTTTGTLIATLPTGYRPLSRQLFTVQSSISTTDIVRVDVDTAGSVLLQAPNPAAAISWVSLNQISFFVA